MNNGLTWHTWWTFIDIVILFLGVCLIPDIRTQGYEAIFVVSYIAFIFFMVHRIRHHAKEGLRILNEQDYQ